MAKANPSNPNKKTPPKEQKPVEANGPILGEAGEYLPATYEDGRGNIRTDY